jgi:hypothetical protein
MDTLDIFPDADIKATGGVSAKFLQLGIHGFLEACRYIHQLPYGYNANRDDLLILFKEGMGSCTTKHAVVATLAEEMDLPIFKKIGIYKMTENVVTGASEILAEFNLPYVPMVHCFLAYKNFRVDLTEGNDNGKNRPLDHFLFTKKTIPNISAKDEYLLYRQALKDKILTEKEMAGVELKHILQAREKGIVLLKSKIS